MTTLTHAVVPEDIMALLDGELTAAEATLISQHIEQCTECAALRDQLRDTSQSLANWTTPAAPATLDRAVEGRLAETAHSKRPPRIKTGFTFRSGRALAVGGGIAVFGALVLLMLFRTVPSYKYRESAEQRAIVTSDAIESVSSQPAQPPAVAGIASVSGYADAVPAPSQLSQPSAVAQLQSAAPADKRAGVASGQSQAPTNAPLIARTASLAVQVKNLDAARGDLDAILTHHHGYSAKLTILEQASPRDLTGSLRIPAGELQTAIAEMRALGIVEQESQSGEEVTQQHTDLTARLANARETEARLRDILAHRTGKMEDVLEVEQNISATRGEIEQLEADQTDLEHRVEFASVDVELTEQYKAQLGSPSTSIPNQMRNSFVAGVGHAGDSLLGLVLFIEEYGPVLLVWLAILGVPGLLLWRRYRIITTGKMSQPR